MKKICLILSALFLFAALSACGGAENEKQKISVVFINVGRADSALIVVGDKGWLIDTGTGDSAYNIISVMDQYNLESLEGVFLTHSHSDHTGGFLNIDYIYQINALYFSDIYRQNGKSDGNGFFVNLAGNTPFVRIGAGESVTAGEDAVFEVIGPLVYNNSDDNDNSLVIRFTAYGKTILFAGDMQFPEEQTLLYAGVDLSADILKVGNHGNPDATSEEFALAVGPEIAVISTNTLIDTNSANPRVLALFTDAQVYITQDYDLELTIEVASDGTISVIEN